MPTVTEGIRSFLVAQKSRVNNAEVIDLACQPGMEVQVNVSPKGDPVDGRHHAWDDGQYVHHHVRIPKGAGTEPHFEDYELRYPLDLYAQAIGVTGFNWKDRRSIFVGFDFDSITGHAPGIGISKDELHEVLKAALVIDWIQARNSTGGKGHHLFAIFDAEGIPCNNHTEHAAIARVVLSMMSEVTGFDFSSRIDACGGNMWIWSRAASIEKNSYKLIKNNSATLSAADLPANWRDHIDVVTRKRSKVRVHGLADEDHRNFDDLAAARSRIELDAKHKAVREVLAKSGFSCVWLQDHGLLQTHTAGLKKLMLKRNELGLSGFFDTLSEGSDPGTPNCFMFPLPDGAWRVYRFSPGAKEHSLWQQDGRDWTTCDFNVSPDLATSAKVFGGVELPNNLGFVFRGAREAVLAADALGQKVELPDAWLSRATTLKSNKDGRLVMEIKREAEDDCPSGWGLSGRKDKWVRVFNVRTDSVQQNREPMDGIVRALVTPAQEFAGYYLRSKQATWDFQPASNAKMVLQSLGYKKSHAEEVLGAANHNRWVQVSIPFAPEFLGGRQWNMGAAKLKVEPAELTEETPTHPHWDIVYNHCGQSLNDVLKHLEWAREVNIRTGADYLRAWVASMIRSPFDRLPYLFFCGPEESGKSIFWESLQSVMTGITKADRALTSQNDFNGELAHTVFAVIEEKDLSQSKGVQNKIKDVVTSLTLSIRKMRTDAFQIPNVTHWAQFSNHDDELAIGSGDTRVTVLHVPELPPGKEIPKPVLLERLTEEAPHFLRTLMDMKLPPLVGRLRLPVVETAVKRAISDQHNPVAVFLRERCILEPQAKVVKHELLEAWRLWTVDNSYETGSVKAFWGNLQTASRHKVKNDAKVIDQRDGKRKDAYAGIRLI